MTMNASEQAEMTVADLMQRLDALPSGARIARHSAGHKGQTAILADWIDEEGLHQVPIHVVPVVGFGSNSEGCGAPVMPSRRMDSGGRLRKSWGWS